MKKLIFIIYVFIVILSVINCKEKLVNYKNENIGYSFVYPKEIAFEDKEFRLKNKYTIKNINGKDTPILLEVKKWVTLDNKYTVNTSVQKVSEYTQDTRLEAPTNNKEIMLNKLKNKENNIFFREENKTRKFYVVDNNIIGEEMMSNNAEYTYKIFLYIVKEDYLITIVLNYYDPFLNLHKKYSSLYKKEADGTMVWKNDKIFEMIMNGDKKAPKELVKLYKYFKDVKKSIKLF